MIDAYTVSQLARYLKELLESELQLTNLWVEGEISNLSRSAAGHVYFTLKDQQAQLRCVMFRRAYGGEPLENGQHVLAHGSIAFYEARGEVQVNVDFVRPAGVGVWQAQLERLESQLEQEGLFSPDRKRPLPRFPQRIGVLTSPTGAVFHDILRVLERRWPLAEVILAPTPVQGPEAVPGIIEGLEALNREGVDVIIMARGGGSLEELWAFNEEAVARAVYASRVPVVCGVGHETDYTIADRVADMRAPTPSAAAELATPERAEMSRNVRSLAMTLQTWAMGSVNQSKARTDQEVRVLQGCLPDLRGLLLRTEDFSRALTTRTTRVFEQLQERRAALHRHLSQLDPRGTLARGYAVVQQRHDGHAITSITEVQPKQGLDVFVRDGHFPVEVARNHGF